MRVQEAIGLAYKNGYEKGLRDTLDLVRCKDCEHLYFKDFAGYCPYRVGPCNPDGYCEYGERRKTE